MQIPVYMLPFDKHGQLQAEQTFEDLATEGVRSVTDIFLFCHGWNNDFADATRLYRRFMTTYGDLVRTHGQPRAGIKPLLVGISWPSIALSSHPAPLLAGQRDETEARELAEAVVHDADRDELKALAGRNQLNEDEVRRLAELLHPLYHQDDDELGLPGSCDVDSTIELWRAIEDETADAELVVSGPQGPAEPVPNAQPIAAGRIGSMLDPRNVVRLATVLLMKDRAGVVGAKGVAPVLARILGTSPRTARVHLIGHSYGCKVLLSAVCAGELPRSVRSMLLMQPALSYLAFADKMRGLDRSGGYQAAKARSELTIVVTWTKKDTPLRKLFQLAVRRRSDMGEQDIGAAGLVTPPSRFAAMGGWGPASSDDVRNETIRLPRDGSYELTDTEVLALESHKIITGHGDVVKDATCWALYNIVSAG
ncbi:hypothetical protein ABZX92_22960 [Lentzea sp. NPDC006480]|uniref:hypothetical protein n=1 Tax=Lentzea sp. NPDC006480 TaxID=3157176 RepID=UPI00339EFCEB